MKRYILTYLGALFLACSVAAFFTGCGSAGTGVSNPPTETQSAGAAVASLFSSNSSDSTSSNIAAKLAAIAKIEYGESAEEGSGSDATQQGRCENPGANDASCTCAEALAGDTTGTHRILNGAYVAPGAYGSTEALLTVEEGDSCADSGGTENTGTGPGGLGRVAKFTLTQAVTGTCTSADGSTFTIAMQAASTGAWRNTTAAQTTTAYQPQVWGNFVMLVDGEGVTVDCTMFLGTGETTEFTDCSDASGVPIAQTTTTTCTFDTDDAS